jgi:hypothetical protein
MWSTMMATQILAALTLTGAFDPVEISRRLGLAPTKVARRDERIGKSALQYKCDIWSISTGKRESLALEEQVREILAQVGTSAHAIRSARDELSISVELACAVYVEGQAPSMTLGPETIAQLAELGAGVDIDLYVLAGPSPCDP